jgi:hypothetical protein
MRSIRALVAATAAIGLSASVSSAAFVFPAFTPGFTSTTWKNTNLISLATPTPGTYTSATVTVNWVGSGGGQWSGEARSNFSTGAANANTLSTPTYATGSSLSAVVSPANGASTGANVPSLTFNVPFTGAYTGGPLFFNNRQTFSGTTANWSSVIVTLNEPVAPTAVSLGAVPAGISGYSSGTVTTSGEVDWYTFTLGAPIALGSWLDITTSGSTGLTDTEIGVYSSTGALVATDDDDATSLLSALSFGSGSGLTLNTGDTTPIVSTGQDGATLPAGTYYLAVAGYNATFGSVGWSVTGGTSAGGSYRVNFNLGPVPEPATLATAFGVAGLALSRRRRLA